MIRRSLDAIALAGALALATTVTAFAQSPVPSPVAGSPGAGASPAASAGAAPCPSPSASGEPAASGVPVASASAQPSASGMPSASGVAEPSLGVPAETLAPSAASSSAPQPSAPAGSPAASPDPATTPPTDDCAAAVVLEIETPASEPLTFSTDTLTAPAGTLVRVEYLNDSNVLHNITFFEGPDASAPRIAGTELGTGPDNLQVVEFTTPSEPGSYFFHCDVHATLMTGTLEVTAAG